MPFTAFIARFAILAVSFLLLWRIIQVNAVLYDDTGRPRLATPGGAFPAREAKSVEKAALRDIVRGNPGEVAALVMLAREFESEGDARQAARAYRSALEIAPLEREVLALSTAFFLKHDDPAGVEILGRLVAHYPEARERAFPVLVELAATGRHRAALAEMFARNPPWLGHFLVDACTRGIDPSVLMPALLGRTSSGIAGPAEAACAIDRLRAAGRWDEAYHLWLNSLPRERLSNVGFVFNGSFEFQPSAIGFDWMLQTRPERETGHVAEILQTLGATDKRALRIIYTGRRQSGVPVQQYLALAPGQYELTGLARPEGIKAPRGIHWTVRCVEQARPQSVIASSERFLGSSEWRRFSMDVRIGNSCRGQVLQLEPVAEEGAVAFVAGTAWFDDLGLRRR